MTINAIQNYTRLMAPAFIDLEKLPVFTFFQNLFAQPEGQTIIEVDANAIDIDIQRGNKKVAAYIKRGTSAVNIGVTKKRAAFEKYTSDTKMFPLIEEESVITSDMITKRMPGEPVSKPFSRIFKQTALAMKAHREHMNRIIRKMEYSAAEAFILGEQTIDSSLKYDFYRRAAHAISAGTVWSTAATASPITDFVSMATLIFQNGNRIPTDVVMGERDWKEFLATTEILALADKRRINHFNSDMNAAAPAGYESWVASGALFQGVVKAGSWDLNLWTYPAIYETNDGTKTKYLVDGKAIMMAKGARYDRYFGPQDRLEVNSEIFRSMFGIGDISGMSPNVVNSGIFSSNMFHVDAYGGDNNKALTIRTQVAPIFPTIESDTIVALTT